MAARKGVTPDQVKAVADELGLSVAAIAEGSGLARAYISEFRNAKRTLNGAQQAQLRSYLEDQCTEAGIDFPEEGEDEAAGKMLMQGMGNIVQRINRPALVLSDDVPKAQRDKLVAMIDANRAKVSELLAGEFEAGGMLGGEFSEATDDAIRQLFALLALNYVAIMVLQGQGATLVRQRKEDAEPKTLGDWLAGYLAASPLAELMTTREQTSREPVTMHGSDE